MFGSDLLVSQPGQTTQIGPTNSICTCSKGSDGVVLSFIRSAMTCVTLFALSSLE